MQLKNTLLLFFFVCFGTTVSAQKYLSTTNVLVTDEWQGNHFTSTKTFAENIEEAPQFTILAKLLKNEALRKTLESEEMVTIFAVTDSAFLKLPKKSRDSLLGNTALMTSMVKYLAVPGRLDSNSLKTAIEKNGGKAYVTTLDGRKLGIQEENGTLVLVDAENNTATIIAPDFYHKHGFFHIVVGFVFPPSE